LYLIEKDKQITEQQQQNAAQNNLLTVQTKQIAQQQKVNQSLQQQINQLAKKVSN
jgi:uncharacterized coiled-coil protein SlyX